uniref:Uncharacterized protein AlNc14C50G3951 n=2 Tax=Albugo laibachii Nc14 TaxID=890382 RepID=F0WBA3_9STRA|nr:conserved hypothetical protein [Albugo laibachii Nc14]|eukprot:CCA18427.1 conserved hypothetical protein [Albugo laibachii Nc14]
MLFYVLHEFFKHFQHDSLEYERIQREWFQTVEDVLYGCVRETKNIDDGKKRLFKTLARWEELDLYPSKMKTWKSIVLGEIKPKRAPIRLPRNEAERLAEYFAMEAENTSEVVNGNLIPAKHDSASANVIDLNRSTCPYLYERKDLELQCEARKQWRLTAIAYIDVLGQCLVLNRDIVLTACSYFHRIFDCGIYAQERFKVAAACLFLAAKAASKRMKLIRMVRTMHDILERPLMMGDEDKLELERLQLLHYELQVLQGIQYELTVDMPFYHLRRLLEGIPSKCDVLKEYRSLCAWKRMQERSFNDLVNWGREHGKDKVEAFAAQRGGLNLVLGKIRNEDEFTKSQAGGRSESRNVKAVIEELDRQGANATALMASSHLHIEEESAKVNIETILTNARVIVEEDRDLAPVEPVELNEATDPKIATVPSILPAKQMLRIDQAIERAQVEVENVSSTPVGLLAAIKMTGVADTTRLTVVEDQGTAPARIDPTRLLASADIGAQAAKRNENIGKECIGKDQESCIW